MNTNNLCRNKHKWELLGLFVHIDACYEVGPTADCFVERNKSKEAVVQATAFHTEAKTPV
jgi:hypothetical protein